MERQTYLNILQKIKEEAKTSPPGILSKGKSIDSYVGHTVINLSDVELTQDQLSALEKASPFAQHQVLPTRQESGLTLKISIEDYA